MKKTILAFCANDRCTCWSMTVTVPERPNRPRLDLGMTQLLCMGDVRCGVEKSRARGQRNATPPGPGPLRAS